MEWDGMGYDGTMQVYPSFHSFLCHETQLNSAQLNSSTRLSVLSS
jgi:hypothetical protein